MVGRGTHHGVTPDILWWVLALLALGAGLMRGPAVRFSERPRDPGMQDPAATDYRNWRPVGPFAY